MRRIITIATLDDRQIMSLMRALAEAIPSNPPTYQIGSAHVSAAEMPEALKMDSRAIFSAGLHATTLRVNVTFQRGTSAIAQNGVVNPSQRVPSPFYDEIILEYNENQGEQSRTEPSVGDILAVEAVLNEYARIFLPEDGSVIPAPKGAIEVLQAHMSQLSSLQARMLADISDSHAKLERSYESQKQKLEADFESRRVQLEDAHRVEMEKIDEQKSILDGKRKLIDDRDNTHVRRDLRQRITDQIEGRVEKSVLPPRLRLSNIAVLIFSVACVIFASVVSFYSYEGFTDLLKVSKETASTPIEHLDWLVVAMVLRGVVSSGVAIGFLIYSISWLRRTYLDNAKAAIDLQRYALDINRASWVIETIMEMAAKEGRVLPDKWIEGVCYGLFQGGEDGKKELTPLDAWGALLNISGKVECGPDGPKMEFNKAQARKLAKG